MQLNRPLKSFRNKVDRKENMKLALKYKIITSYRYHPEDWENIIDTVSERLVNITDTELQKRSADELASLIVYWKDNLGYYDDRLDTLQKIANEEISEEQIIKKNKGFDIPEGYADGLNKSRKKRRKKRPKKKSLESRKKRRKEKKSLKLRRRRRKRNKKKTKKRE